MLLEIKSGQMPTNRGMVDVHFQIETDDVAAVGNPDGDGIYRVTMKDGRDYEVQGTALPRAQFMAAWKGNQITGSS